MDMTISFEEFWKAAKPSLEFANRKFATRREWDKRSLVAQKAMYNDVATQNGLPSSRNPYFYVQDFREPEPYNWNGDRRIGPMMRAGRLVSACYNGRWGMYSIEDVQDFGLQTRKN